MFLKEIHKSLQIAVTLVNRDVIESLKVPIREPRSPGMWIPLLNLLRLP